ncbi:MAG: hypothetical protein ACSLEN_04780 [Candidatus Malihini olakiniferum]
MQDVRPSLIPPVWYEKGGWEHIFGTDMLGRDYFSRLLFGARVSLLIDLASAALAEPPASPGRSCRLFRRARGRGGELYVNSAPINAGDFVGLGDGIAL